LSGTKYRGLNPYRGVAERLRRVGFVVERVREGYGIDARRR
ncbi:MAG: methyltransferase, partial [Pyrobaculum sp.]